MRKAVLLVLTIFCVTTAGCELPENASQSSSTTDKEQYASSKASAESFNNPLVVKVIKGFPLPNPEFELFEPGVDAVLDYTKYGKFKRLGTPRYNYEIQNRNALKRDIGAGIFPNHFGIFNDPQYQEMKEQGLLSGYHWDYLNTNDFRRDFYIWTQAPDDKGVRTFFTAYVLENSGHIVPALKTYYAAAVHFPKSVAWAADKSFVWYVSEAAMANVHRICQEYPQLELELVDDSFSVKNGYDANISDDVIAVNPGRFVQKTLRDRLREAPSLDELEIVETRGKGEVQLVKYSIGHWQLLVNGKPHFIKGITYNPTEIGLGPHNDPNFLDRWMKKDGNNNGIIDAPYEAWADKNKNGVQDDNEPPVGDFQLMKNIGVNTIRWYAPNNPKTTYDPSLVNKEVLRDMTKTYGIKVIVGDFLGSYTIGNNATWEDGTDYANPEQRQMMKDVVRAKVMDLKDEPFVLMWLLGNENNMASDHFGHNATRTNASLHPKAYAKFLNEVAAMIHEIDGNHPVAIGNIETGLFEYYKKYAPQIDVLGINSYRGSGGFGNLWASVKDTFDRPIVITEYGSDAYFQGRGVDEKQQMLYHRGCSRDIILNSAGGPGVGNSLGGIVFEYIDEWWKDTFDHPEDEHQTEAQFKFPFADGYSHEEWYGIVGQGSGTNSPFERELREAYYYYQDLWNE